MKTPRIQRGITLFELIVVLAVLAILVSLLLPSVSPSGLGPGQMTQALNNERHIYQATLDMFNDGISSDDKSIGWPGDLVASGTMPCKITDFVKVLVEHDYLKTGDLKVFAASGVTPFADRNINKFTANLGSNNNCAYTVYCVQQSDAPEALFLSTINATLDVSSTTFKLDAKAVPFGDRGYVIFHKGGDGAILGKNQALRPNLQGVPCQMAISGTAALRAE